MKKLLLLFGLFIFTISFANAQKRWTMDFSKSYIVNNNPSHDPGFVDTAYVGTWVYFQWIAQNNGTATGPDSFPGGFYTFNWYVSTKTNDWPAPFIYGTSTLDFPGTYYKGYSQAAIDSVYIDSHFKVGFKNITIIWPNGGKGSGNAIMDSMNNSVYSFLNIYVKDKKAGTTGIETSISQNFKIYPNPVKDVLNIEMNNAGKGTLKVTDLAGKVIATKPFETTKGGHVSLLLNGGAALPEGVYFINVETPTYTETSKILIEK
jgi:type IX secretion system substrate protein